MQGEADLPRSNLVIVVVKKSLANTHYSFVLFVFLVNPREAAQILHE